MSQQKSKKGYYTLQSESDLLDGIRDSTAFVIYHKMRQRMDKETKVCTVNGWEELIHAAKLPVSLSVVAKKSKARRAVEELVRAGLLVRNSKNEYKLSFVCVLAPDYVKYERDTDSTHNSTRKTTHQEEAKDLDLYGLREDRDGENDRQNDTVGDTDSTSVALSPHTPLSKNSNKKDVLCSINAYARGDENLIKTPPRPDDVMTEQQLYDFMHFNCKFPKSGFCKDSRIVIRKWARLQVTWRTVREAVEIGDAKYGRHKMTRPASYDPFITGGHAAEQEAKKIPHSAVTLEGEKIKQTTIRGPNDNTTNRRQQPRRTSTMPDEATREAQGLAKFKKLLQAADEEKTVA